MTTRESHRRRFIEQIISTQPDELDCAAVVAVIDRYVDLKADGNDPSDLAPGLPLHLQHCPDCADMYAALLMLVELEANDHLPDVDALWRDIASVARPPPAPSPPVAMAQTSVAGDTLFRRVARRLRGGSRPAPLAEAGVAAVGAGLVLPAWALPALATVSIVLGAGWWRSDGRAARAEAQLAAAQARLNAAEQRSLPVRHALEKALAELEDANGELADYSDVVEVMRQVDQHDFRRNADGSWARVFFNPNQRRALVFMGGIPEPKAGQTVEGWLVHAGAGALSTGVVPHEVMQTAECWAIDGDGPMGDSTTFVLTLEPEHTPIVSVPLIPDRS